MKTIRSIRVAPAALVFLATAACAAGMSQPAQAPDAPAPAAARGEPVDSALAVATFDSAWTVIHRTHFDSTFGGVDWAAVRTELRPRAAAARTDAELRAVLNEMLGRLRESHFYLIPADASESLGADEEDGEEAGDGDAGLDVRLVDGRFLVTRVREGGPAAAAGVRTGWSVEAVDSLETARVLAALARLPEDTDPRVVQLRAWSAVIAALRGDAGKPVRIRFRDARDEPVALDVVRGPAPGTRTKFGNLPEMRVSLEGDTVQAAGVRAGVIRFSLWMPVLSRPFDEAVDAMRGLDGIVIDLRGNFGGVGGMSMGVAGHFTATRDTIGTLQTRDTRLHFVTNPRRVNTRNEAVQPYAGPVAVLTDALSISTSEIFAGGLQRIGRARVFGETTAGQALPALMRKLPTGDVLVHAYADFTAPGGYRMEGAGVVPDVQAPPTRAALLAGGDPALDAALRWIAEENAKRRSN